MSNTKPIQHESLPGKLSRPYVSIVVPTRNRAPYVRSLLNALSAQIYPSDCMEVVVVDNSSSDDTEEVVLTAAAQASFCVHYLRKKNEGPAAARNLGIMHCTGEFVAFTDSDCLPSPRWLLDSVTQFRESDGLVCGPIAPIMDGTMTLFVHQVAGTFRDIGIYATANVVYRRSVLKEIGGFDEQFGAYSWGTPMGGEDTDLAWRVRRAGYTAHFVPSAVVYHQATPISLKEGLLSSVQAQVIPRLLVTVPELRDTFLWRRYFVGPHTAAFYLALAGIALAARRRWGLLLVLPWLRLVWPAFGYEIWPPGRWINFAARTALTIQGACLLVFVLIRSSIRHRRLVL